MAFTPSTVATTNISTLDSLPNDVGGLTAPQLQYLFDKFGIDFSAYFADHLAELASITAGTSGANNIAMTPIPTIGVQADVQSVVEALIARLQAVTAGLSGAKFVGVETIAGLTGNDVQTLLAALKVLVDGDYTAQSNALGTHKTSADHDGRYFTETELTATTGAGLVGATAPSGLTGTTVQALINALKTAIDGVVLSGIVDGSLTDIKLSNTAGQIKERVSTHLADLVKHGLNSKYDAIVDPTVNDDGVSGKIVGSRWINTLTGAEFVCVDITTGLARWRETTPGNKEITKHYVYGVKIDTTNSNPATALTYTDDAVGFTPALGNNGAFNAGSWADKFPFNQIKPCLYKAGAINYVNYYLNPNNYAQKIDGVTASDITSGTDGDVMVEFPKIWWKFETIGSDLYVRYSDTQVDAGYKCLAHLRDVNEKDKCYISAYLGFDLTSKLRSLSGKTPTATQTIGAFRTLAQANGAGYDQVAYFQLLMLQVLSTVMFKNRDSQTALGRGYVDANAAAIATGGTNAKGMFYGETTGKLQNKFCGIEDFYGNLRYWVDGFFSNATRNMLIANQIFNDAGSGYVDYGQGATANLSGYISAVQGGTETGFIVKATAGSTTTYYPDNGYLYASCLLCFGGSCADADVGGAFSLVAVHDASYSVATFGARIMAV